MNKSYRLVWSSVRSAWTVVSELAKAHVKSGAAVVLISAASFCAASGLAVQGGEVMELTGENLVVSGLGPSYAVYIIGHPTTGKTSTLLFKSPTTISISSESYAAIRADNGIMKDNGANGNYTIMSTTNYAAGATIEAYNGSNIDLSSAAKITMTSSHARLILADNSTNSLSNLQLNRR